MERFTISLLDVFIDDVVCDQSISGIFKVFSKYIETEGVFIKPEMSNEYKVFFKIIHCAFYFVFARYMYIIKKYIYTYIYIYMENW